MAKTNGQGSGVGESRTLPVRLEVVPVPELSDEAQHFRCLPLAAVLTARVCLLRQAQHGARVRWHPTNGMVRRSLGEGGRGTVRLEFGACARCELGERVRKAVGA